MQAQTADADGYEPLALETLLAHRDRAPLAWVGAAIVERGVDQLF